ncbi:MAG: hypothetical protein RDV48_18945 [Candidatus Eremiobacteraeota bacterium]|nr:hypothetical protein [Candidatus Eremiobacteraeota bacterium]
MKRILMLTLLMLLAAQAVPAGQKPSSTTAPAEKDYKAYQSVIQQCASMVGNGEAQKLAQRHGLQILNVTWEDTGRYKGSSVGPNISDMTIQVQQQDPSTQQYQLTCMPVIRYPNFEDKSGDISPDSFYLLVGNQKGLPLKKVTLSNFLKNIRQYLTDSKSWKGKGQSLFAPSRDTHVLVSAQACFLPVPKKGIAEFNPVLFNYQSYEGDPAVLTILCTREGTSATVIDNKRDGFAAGMTWGQRLFFNQKGERASLTGTRLSDYKEERGTQKATGKSAEAAGQGGLNMVLLVQVPLKQKNPMRFKGQECSSGAPGAPCKATCSRSDVEEAVIGHGKIEGPFTELADLSIERDEKFPVRVTVQFYKATSNGVVSEKDISDIASQINKVYKEADYVGSLVTGGKTGRPTEYDGDKFEPPDWWDSFWKRHQQNTGLTPEETIRMLRKLYGPNYTPRSEKELEGKMKTLKKSQ